MLKKHFVNLQELKKKEATVRRQLLLQMATLMRTCAVPLCPVWPIVRVVLVEAGDGICCGGKYSAESDHNGNHTCAQSTLAKELWACVHTRI